MKRETWKLIVQILISILTAITTTLTTTSCVRSHSSSSTARHIGLTKRHLPTRLTETTASGAHCVGHNAHSIGVCYEGGLDIRGRPADTRTEAQRHSLRKLIEQLHAAYPKALIVGHHDLNPQKDCPCFDAVAEYSQLNGK